ncbi:TetR/AcrR family transcriptional regulator [Actinomadura rubrisoli]|uniref:TetR/AcrR family transcriptional regulator n=1 Tax=Actinomadura rubrisoli TaxID=2530368 RepID=A0A4R4ZV61_9ACTN|nr:TetR/AcrR family transcriptional regulator [Actinomadura rubrisoli]TDD62266.1 TetR/AcrR family transcriptional regulator [Actinomadura rubrisoli]
MSTDPLVPDTLPDAPRRADGAPGRADGAPRRADARRNRERILQAALEAFAADGMLVPLDDIARRAGVGAGTVYRNFPTKEALFKAVVADRIHRIVDEAKALIDAEDPAEAFYGFLLWVVERAMFNHALCESITLDKSMGAFHHAGVDDEFNEALGGLLRRAQDAGAVRADVDVLDIRALLTGCMVMERGRRVTGPPGRMTVLACDALRPSPVTELPPLRNETHTVSRNETPAGEARCEVCGTALTTARTGRPARFCGANCRQKAHRRRATEAPPSCG